MYRLNNMYEQNTAKPKCHVIGDHVNMNPPSKATDVSNLCFCFIHLAMYSE